MKISYNWLQQYIQQELPTPEQLAEVVTAHVWEVEEIEHNEVYNDYVLDIKVLPDRAHDALSHYGIAREVAGLLGFTLKPLLQDKEHTYKSSTITVDIKTDLCTQYAARKITSIKVAESPAWLKEKLEVIGQRSINNVVDATNYVLFATGQPTHAFDADKLGDGIKVRMANEGEQITTLDAKECVLNESMMVVSTAQGNALAIAGIKGGTFAQVNNDTKNIVLEVANFNAASVRKTSKKLQLQTDAAKRFENEISPTLINNAMQLLTDTLLQVAGGEAEEVVRAGEKNDSAKKQVAVSIDFISKRLGMQLSGAEIANVLSAFSYDYIEENGFFTVHVPHYRLDLNFDYDLVDEIGRVIGYEKVTPAAPTFFEHALDNDNFTEIATIRSYLLQQGYNETITYSFTKKGDVEIFGGIKGKSALRTNILDGLKESFELNKTNAALFENEDIKMFEIGSIFPQGTERFSVAVIAKKEANEYTLEEFLEKFPMAQTAGQFKSTNNNDKFVPWSTYPFIVRDIAVWVPENLDKQELVDLYKSLGTDLLVRAPRLIDSFSKEGRTSYAFRLVFQSFDKTLTDEDVKPITDSIYSALSERGWEIR